MAPFWVVLGLLYTAEILGRRLAKKLSKTQENQSHSSERQSGHFFFQQCKRQTKQHTKTTSLVVRNPAQHLLYFQSKNKWPRNQFLPYKHTTRYTLHAPRRHTRKVNGSPCRIFHTNAATSNSYLVCFSETFTNETRWNQSRRGNDNQVSP